MAFDNVDNRLYVFDGMAYLNEAGTVQGPVIHVLSVDP
jgi:hypothetical protein